MVLDVMLPGKDGVTLLKMMKNSDALVDIPVIMATAKEVDFENSTLEAEFWHGEFCYEKSTVEEKQVFPLTEAGKAAMKTWLEEHI